MLNFSGAFHQLPDPPTHTKWLKWLFHRGDNLNFFYFWLPSSEIDANHQLQLALASNLLSFYLTFYKRAVFLLLTLKIPPWNRAAVGSRQLSLLLWVITRVVLSSHWRSEATVRCKWLLASISVHLFETLQRPTTANRKMSFGVKCRRNFKCRLCRRLRSQLIRFQPTTSTW